MQNELNEITSADLLRILFSRASSNAFKPSACGIIGYSPPTTTVACIELTGRFFICFIFLGKSPEYLIFNQLLCITVFKWWSKNLDNFPVEVSQLNTTGRPGILKSFL